MEEKRKDLTASKQREYLTTIITELNKIDPSFYYASTSEIAYQIELYIQQGNNLGREELQALSNLDRNQIQMILSLHSEG